MRVENSRFTYDISEAVSQHVRADPYLYSGRLEQLESQVSDLTALVGRLFEALAKNGNLRANEVDQIFNYEYTVKDD